MADDYDRRFCDERHRRIESDIKALFTRLNWFYLIGISTLAMTVANLLK